MAYCFIRVALLPLTPGCRCRLGHELQVVEAVAAEAVEVMVVAPCQGQLLCLLGLVRDLDRVLAENEDGYINVRSVGRAIVSLLPYHKQPPDLFPEYSVEKQ